MIDFLIIIPLLLFFDYVCTGINSYVFQIKMYKSSKLFAKTVVKETESDKGKNVSKPINPTITKPKRFLLGALMLFVTIFFHKTIAAKTAMLYIMGDNGKKSGRASGNVYSRNGVVRGMGFFAKAFSPFVAVANAIFAFFSSNWKNLTSAQRTAWNNTTYFVSNRFAVVKKLTGHNAYIQLNVNIANAEGTAIDNPPSAAIAKPTYVALTGGSATASTGVVNIAYVPDAGAGTAFIFATKPLSPGISKPSKNAFRLMSIGDFSAASPIIVSSDYTDRFGAITDATGSVIYFRVVVVNPATGLTGTPYEVAITIV